MEDKESVVLPVSSKPNRRKAFILYFAVDEDNELNQDEELAEIRRIVEDKGNGYHDLVELITNKDDRYNTGYYCEKGQGSFDQLLKILGDLLERGVKEDSELWLLHLSCKGGPESIQFFGEEILYDTLTVKLQLLLRGAKRPTIPGILLSVCLSQRGAYKLRLTADFVIATTCKISGEFSIETTRTFYSLFMQEGTISAAINHINDQIMVGLFKENVALADDGKAQPFVFVGTENPNGFLYSLESIHETPPSKKFWNFSSKNENFSGREKLLQDIEGRLSNISPDTLTTMVALCGMGGVGKTQLVQHYAYSIFHKYPHRYRNILWVNSKTTNDIENAYSKLASDLEINAKTSEELVKSVKRWLELNPLNLVICDDAPDYDTIMSYLPKTGSHVLVTSRYTEWPSSERMEVDCYTMEECRAYIQKVLGKRGLDSIEDIDNLAETTLGRLPLALAQACGYMTQGAKISIKAYLAQYEKYLENPLLPAGESTRKGKNPIHPPVFITFMLAKEAIEKESPLAGNLLGLCAFLHHEKIPDFLLNAIGVQKEWNPREEDVEEAHTLLGNFSLLARDLQGKFSNMHVLLQEAIQLNLNKEKQRNGYIKCLISFLNQLFNYKKYSITADDWLASKKVNFNYEKLVDHVYQLSTNIDVENSPVLPKEIHHLLLKLAQYCIDVKSNYTLAGTILNKISQLHESSTLKTDLLAKAELVLEKGNLSLAVGNYEQAIKEFEEAVSSYEHGGADQVNKGAMLGVLYCQLGNAYYFLGQYSKAESCYKSVFSIQQNASNEIVQEKVNIAVAWCGIANIMPSSEYEEAMKAYDMALDIYDAISTQKDHKSIANIYCLQAELHYQRRAYSEALQLYKKAEETYRSVYGSEYHLDVAICLYNLSQVLYKLGKNHEALQSITSSLKLYRKIYAVPNLDMVAILFQLAFFLCRKGSYHSGLIKYQRALNICEEILRDEGNIDSLLNLRKYADGYYRNGELSKAEQCYLLIMISNYPRIKKKGTRVTLIYNMEDNEISEISPLVDRYNRYKGMVQKTDDERCLSLIDACYQDDQDKVRQLCVSVANINKANSDSVTPLYAAACSGHLQVVKILVELGNADLTTGKWTGEYTETPLIVASQNGYENIVKYIVDYVNKNKEKNSRIWEFPLYLRHSHEIGALPPSRVNEIIGNIVEHFIEGDSDIRNHAAEILLNFDKSLLPGLYHLRESQRSKILRSGVLRKVIFKLALIDAEVIIFLLKNAMKEHGFLNNNSETLTLLKAFGICDDLPKTLREDFLLKNKLIDMTESVYRLMKSQFIFSPAFVNDDAETPAVACESARTGDSSDGFRELFFENPHSDASFDDFSPGGSDDDGLLDEFIVAVRAMASIVKKQHVSEDNIVAILSYFNHEDALIRFAAKNTLLTLKLIENKLVRNFLMQSCSNTNWRIRRDSIELLEEMDAYDSEVEDHLSNALKDKSCYVSLAAATALCKKNRRDTSVAQILDSSLSETDWKIRYNTVKALAYFPSMSKSLLTHLIQMLIDDDEDVRLKTVATLKYLAKDNRRSIIEALNEVVFQFKLNKALVEVITLLKNLCTNEDVGLAVFLIMVADDHKYRYEDNGAREAMLILRQLFVDNGGLYKELSIDSGWVSLRAIKNAVSILPNFKNDLFGNTIKVPDIFRKVVNTISDLKQVLEIFPEQKNILLQLFRDLIINSANFTSTVTKLDYWSLKDLAELFPEYEDTLFKLVGDSDFFKLNRKGLYDLGRLTTIFPKYRETLFATIVEDAEWFSLNVSNSENLSALGDMFPEQKSILIERIMKDQLWISKNIKSCNDLHILGKVYSEHREILFTKFIEDDFWFSAHVKDVKDIASLASVFPEHRSELFNKTVSDQKWFSENVKVCSDIVTLTEAFMEHTPLLLERTIENPQWFSVGVTSILDLRKLIEKFPEQRETLFAKIVLDATWLEKSLEDTYGLKNLAEIFSESEQKETLFLKTVENPAWFEKFVIRACDVDYLLKTFPQKKETLFLKTAGNATWFKKFVRSTYDLELLVKIFPEQKEALLLFAKTVHDVTQFELPITLSEGKIHKKHF